MSTQQPIYCKAYGAPESGLHAIIILPEGGFPDLPKPEYGSTEPGPWVDVRDERGWEWQVRSADCGAGCHCAAEARLVSNQQQMLDQLAEDL